MAPATYKDLCLDADDRIVLGRFWAAVLGLELVDRGDVGDIPGAPFESLDVAAVPEPKSATNRVHLDLFGDVAEIVASGGTVVDGQPRWTVMADVEGNEFCVFPRP